jgi:DnaJ family protein C protein 7
MPSGGQKDGTGRRLGQRLSQFFGRSKSRGRSPSPMPKTTTPSTAIPSSGQSPLSPSSQSAVYSSTTAQPTTSPYDPYESVTLAHPVRQPSFVYGKVDVNIPKSRQAPPMQPTHPARSPSITITPPVQTSPYIPFVSSPSDTDPVKQGESYRQIGNAAVASGRFDEAVAEYTKALQSDPYNAQTLSDRSYAYLVLSRFHDARR